MLFLSEFQRILFLFAIVKATIGQKEQQRQQWQQQQQQHYYELLPETTISQNIPNFLHTLVQKQYENQKPKHRFQYENQQKENGNSLAATEIAMEILSDSLPSNTNTKIFNDVFSEQVLQQLSPYNRLFDFLRKRANFRAMQLYAQRQKQQQQQQQVMNKLNSENSNWHEHIPNVGQTNGFAPVVNDDSKTLHDELMHETIDSETSHTYDEDEVNWKYTKPELIKNAANDENNIKSVHSLIMANINDDDIALGKDIIKRNPLSIDDYKYSFAQPHYPIALIKDISNANAKENINPMKLRSSKRERLRTMDRTMFLPSISAGAMTNLGHFFDDLSKNVHYNEQHDIQEARAKLLEGDHPLRMLQRDVDADSDENAKIDKTSQFLHAIRSYRPSQRIRSLVSMNPQGYHGSNFLDPNYMWVGLG